MSGAKRPKFSIGDIVLSAPIKAYVLLSPSEETTPSQSIDELLDMYNDYKYLYEWFGDEQYKQMMETVVKRLRIVANYHNKN